MYMHQHNNKTDDISTRLKHSWVFPVMLTIDLHVLPSFAVMCQRILRGTEVGGGGGGEGGEGDFQD